MSKNRVIRIWYVQDNNENLVVINRQKGERQYSLNKIREARMVQLMERLCFNGRAVLTHLSVRATWEIQRGRRAKSRRNHNSPNF